MTESQSSLDNVKLEELIKNFELLSVRKGKKKY